MELLQITETSKPEIIGRFEHIAQELMNNYFIKVNDVHYRIVDLEFYYYAPGVFMDGYVQREEILSKMGNWFFHSGGIDITFGNGTTFGSFTIRSVAKINVDKVDPLRDGIEKVFYGPLIVKKEICSNFKNAWEGECNILQIVPNNGIVRPAKYILTSRRMGLNPNRQSEFFNYNLRFVMLSDHFVFSHKDKSSIVKHNMYRGRITEDEGKILLGFKANA